MIGTIAGVHGEPMSGIAVVVFEEGPHVPIEAGFGLRQLAAAAENQGRNTVVGMTIDYETDDLGVMAGFDIDEEEA